MRARILLGAFVSLAMIGLLMAPSVATPGGTFKAALTGYEEVPAVSTDASGTFRAKVDPAGPTIEYELSYSDIQNAFAAHIHFGQSGVNGGVSAFLCGGGDKPPCPGASGTVTGVIDPTDVIGPNGQGIEPEAMNELLDAMRAGVTYANVHSSRFPGGEIRGQIRRGGGD